MKDQLEEAKDAISKAEERAKKAIADAAAEAMKVRNAEHDGDHDLLIRLDTKLDQLATAVKELQDGTTRRISNLENTKLDVKDSYPILYKETVDRRLNTQGLDIETLKDFKTTQTILLSVGIGLLIVLFGLLSYHIFGVKL